MPAATARRIRKVQFLPRLEGLEVRALNAIGQVTLFFPTTSNNGPAVRGDLPAGLIDVGSYSFDTTNPTTIGTASTGVGAGRISFGPLQINTANGRHSANLFRVQATGAHFPTGVLVVRDEAARQIATYEFGIVVVNNVTYAGAGGDSFPTESYTFNYGSLRLTTYNPATNQATGTQTWNRVTNTPIYDFGSPAPVVNNLSLDTSDAGPAADPPAVGRLSVATSDVGLLVAEPAPVAIPLTNAHIATRVQLTSTRRSGPEGRTVTLRARATSAAGAPVGDVTFFAGKDQLGTAPVGADGTAALTVSASALRRSRPFAIFSGAPDSEFLPSTSVRDGGRLKRLFERFFDRPMTQDEWTLSSIWIQQGINMMPIYRRISGRAR